MAGVSLSEVMCFRNELVEQAHDFLKKAHAERKGTQIILAHPAPVQSPWPPKINNTHDRRMEIPYLWISTMRVP